MQREKFTCNQNSKFYVCNVYESTLRYITTKYVFVLLSAFNRNVSFGFSFALFWLSIWLFFLCLCALLFAVKIQLNTFIVYFVLFRR